MTRYILEEIGYEQDNSIHTAEELLEVAQGHAKSYEDRVVPTTLDEAITYFNTHAFKVILTEQ